MTINSNDFLQLDRRDPTTSAGSMAAAQVYGTAANTVNVTQATSRTTGVTINSPVGTITLFNAAGSATPASFTVTNSFVALADTIEISVQFGTNTYQALVTQTALGSFQVTFSALVGIAADSAIFNFAVTKCAIV